MKNFIKKCLTLTSIIILTIYTVSSIRFGSWMDTIFLWELLIVSGFLCLAQLLLNYFKSNYYLLELLAEYSMVCIIVSASGLLLGWFNLSYIWHVLIYVTPIYVVGYLLDLGRTKRDVDFINKRIQERLEGCQKDE